MLREGKASGRRTADDSTQFGWKAALRHNISIQCVGQPVLPKSCKVSYIKFSGIQGLEAFVVGEGNSTYKKGYSDGRSQTINSPLVQSIAVQVRT